MANTVINIYNALQSILKIDANVRQYFNPNCIFLGNRNNVPEQALPAIVIWPGITREVLVTVPRGFDVTVEAHIWIKMLGNNLDTQVTGGNPADGLTPGILKLEQVVKNAIDAYPDLNFDGAGRRVDKFYFPTTPYDTEDYPNIYAKIIWEGKVKITGAAR